MSERADRNLLFGVLALQMDFITEAQLIQGMHAWVSEKSTPLSEILFRSEALSKEHLGLLEPLVDAHITQHGGVAENSLQSLSASVGTLRSRLESVDPEVEKTLASISGTRGNDNEITATYSTLADSMRGDRFVVLRPHAEGGIGTVSIAHDAELDRQVALKEIHERHADNEESRARFIMEARITGGLEHPGIVPVYGLGQRKDGKPFYAMRFIKGESLRDASETFHLKLAKTGPTSSRRLELRELLSHFLSACKAIDYAHSRGVLHRDLKPSNIMLGKYGETHVVDWGLAKVVGRESAAVTTVDEPTLHPTGEGNSTPTVMGSAIGTPAYMSPEQADGRLDDLGPSSDVYSLGATLYFVLAGQAPFTEKSTSVVLKKVLSGNFEPPRDVVKVIPKPLNAVCLKAMSLNAKDRYSSPREIAVEIEKWMADQSVSAFKDSIATRIARGVKRHQTAAATALTAILLVCVGLAVLTTAMTASTQRLAQANRTIQDKSDQIQEQNDQLTEANSQLQEIRIDADQRRIEAEAERAAAETSRQRAQMVTEYLVEAFRSPDPERSGVKVHVVEILGQAVDGLDDLTEDPEIVARLAGALGATYSSLEIHDRALELHQRSLAIRQEQDPHAPETLATMHLVADSHLGLGNLDEAESIHEEVHTLRREHLGPAHEDTVVSKHALANVYLKQGRISDAIALHELAYEMSKEVLGAEHQETFVSMIAVGDALREAGRLKGSLKWLEQVGELTNDMLGPADPLSLNAQSSLARTLYALGRFDQAIGLDRQTLLLRSEHLGDDHPDTVQTMNTLGLSLWRSDQLDESQQLFEKIVMTSIARNGEYHPQTLTYQTSLALVLESQGDVYGALKIDQEVLEARIEMLGEEHPSTLQSMSNLAMKMSRAGYEQMAIPLMEEVVNVSGRVLGEGNRRQLLWSGELARMYFDIDRDDDALKLLLRTVDRQTDTIGRNHPDTLDSMHELGHLLVTLQKLDFALKVFTDAHRGYESLFGPQHSQSIKLLRDVANLHQDVERHDEAIEIYRIVLKLLRREHGESIEIVAALEDLAQAYRDTEQFERAVTLLEKSLEIRLADETSEPDDIDDARHLLGHAFERTGDYQQAREMFAAAEEGFRSRNRYDYENIVAMLLDVGRVARHLEEFDDAIVAYQSVIELEQRYDLDDDSSGSLVATFREASASKKRDDQPEEALNYDMLWLEFERTRESGDPVDLADALLASCQTLMSLDRFAEAEPLMRECLKIRQDEIPDSWFVHDAESLLGSALVRLESYNEAEAMLLSAVTGLRAKLLEIPADSRNSKLRAPIESLIRLYEATENSEEHLRWQSALAELDSE